MRMLILNRLNMIMNPFRVVISIVESGAQNRPPPPQGAKEVDRERERKKATRIFYTVPNELHNAMRCGLCFFSLSAISSLETRGSALVRFLCASWLGKYLKYFFLVALSRSLRRWRQRRSSRKRDGDSSVFGGTWKGLLADWFYLEVVLCWKTMKSLETYEVNLFSYNFWSNCAWIIQNNVNLHATWCKNISI